jgi:hypothetical protein
MREGLGIVAYLDSRKKETGLYPDSIDIKTNYKWFYINSGDSYDLRCYYFYFRDSWFYSSSVGHFIHDKDQ